MKSFWIKRGLKFVLFGTVFVLAAGGSVMLLWNWLIPALFAGPVVTFGQALGLLVLSKILFGGFRGRGSWGGGPDRWKHKMAERWKNATPEQRERMKHRFRGRFESTEPETTL